MTPLANPIYTPMGVQGGGGGGWAKGSGPHPPGMAAKYNPIIWGPYLSIPTFNVN